MVDKANRINFTKAAILALEPTGKLAYWYDTRTSGLMLLVTPKGAKTFYVYRKVQGRPERIKLGTWPAMTVELARRKAAETLGRIAAGANPAKERRQALADPTLAELFAWYIETHAKPRKRTWADDEAQFGRYCGPIAKRQVSQLTRADVRQWHAKVGVSAGHYAANRALALVRCVIGKGMAGELLTIAINPAAGVDKFPEQSRDRRLSDPEAVALIEAALSDHDPATGDFVLLALMTGARRSNVQAMRWDQVDWEAGTWRIPQTKNGTPQTIPLSPAELAILGRRRTDVAGPWVFPGPGKTGHMVEPKKGWARILKAAGIEGLRLHDLRRTLGSRMADTGATTAIIGKALHHLSPEATAIYTRVAMDPVRQAKAQAIAPWVALLTERGVVVPAVN